MSLVADIHRDLERGVLGLMTEYRERLFSEAVRLCVDVSSAEDLVSRTFAKAVFKFDSYKEDDNLYGWMKTIMVNLHRDDQDRPVARGTTPVPAEALELYAGADNSTDEQILRNSDHDALREAINRLDPEYRQMMAMYYYNELSLKEIASFFRTSTSSVSRKLEIARKILAAKLGTQLGKKPVALILAALLGVGTLFGAWVSPLGDWVAEKVFGSAPAAETVQDEEPAPDVDLPSDIEDPDDNELPDNSIEPDGEARVASTPARQADTNVISETQKQESEDNMNISTDIKKTVAVATVAAMGLTAVAEDKGVTYTLLEYIESTGSQYVDTGVAIDHSFKVRMDVKMNGGSECDTLI